MYDHDPEEVEVLGWEEFIARQWESIFAGYQSWVGLRGICRRWTDLIEVGLGCSQDVADLLVKTTLIEGADRDLEGAANAQTLVSGMIGVLVDLQAGIRELSGTDPELPARLLEEHAGLLAFVRSYASGQDASEVSAP